MNNYTDRLQRTASGWGEGSSTPLTIQEESKTILKEIAEKKYPQLQGADIVYNNTQKEKQTMLLEALEYAVSHPEFFKIKEEGITGEINELIENFQNWIDSLIDHDSADVRKTAQESQQLINRIKSKQAGFREDNLPYCTLTKKEEGEDIRKELTEIITDVWATKGATEKNHPFDENAVERSEHKKVRRQYIPEVVNEIMQLFSTLPSTTEGKTDKGWVALFKDESEFAAYTRWRGIDKEEKTALWKCCFCDSVTNFYPNDGCAKCTSKAFFAYKPQEKDNTVTEGKEYENISTNPNHKILLETAPSEPSTIPVVDYKKEAEDIFDKNFIQFKGETYISRADFINEYIRARQMSSPSDSNGKIKELIEWLKEQKTSVGSEYDCGKVEAIEFIIYKANSLIQQDNQERK